MLKDICRCCLLVMLLACSSAGAASQPCCAKSSAAQKETLLWRKLEAQILEIDGRLDGVMGVAIEDLATGHTLFLNPDEVMPQASSIKVTVLAELYRQHQAGKLKLEDPYTVDAGDLVEDSYIMGGLTPGLTRVTNRDLATMMVAVSDNSAANVLIGRVGMENVNAFLDSLGLHQTRLRRKMMDLKAAGEGRENISTPREMMTFLDSLFRGKVLNEALTRDFFKVLATPKDSWIARYLPEELKMANKPGSLEGVRNDSGVVFSSRPYIICVMTTYLHNEREGEEAIAQISRAAYRMFDRLGRASDLGRVISPGNSSK